jgi:serine-aspartate repeat-containing protein C/D/E
VENATGIVLTGLTSADGSFQICGLASGEDFRVTSPAPLGFSNTGPGNGVIAQRLFAKDFAYIIQVCMNNVPNLLFPSAPIPGSIGGVKFQDTNANGARDPGEPLLAGVTIKLTPSSGAAQTAVTAADGSFLFTGLAAGTYVLTETVPTGFTQTQPASGGITVNLATNGSSVGNVFGNFNGILTGTISGTKFNDLNGNGVRDSGEPGLGGVTINLSSFRAVCRLRPRRLRAR